MIFQVRTGTSKIFKGF